ncbi:hypothetical protein [Streptomyces sp. NPDC096152]|uniref:hypothetical protein n=1 Tax=Streptomyces sp. NPDC096152 TaxID=3366078 RepID=UPI00381F709A
MSASSLSPWDDGCDVVQAMVLPIGPGGRYRHPWEAGGRGAARVTESMRSA